MPLAIGVPGVTTPPAGAVVKTARQQEAAGFDSIWWSDHLMGWHPEAIWTPEFTPLALRTPSPHVFLDHIACQTVAAMSTERVRIGVGVTEPVRHHPAMLAQQYLTLDHFSGGRTILGMGTGEGENTIPYGLDFSRPVGRLEEALEIIRLLWSTDEPVDFDGDFWTMRGAVMGLQPLEAGPPPIWLAGLGPRMLGVTARLADGWIPIGLTAKDYADKLARILQLRDDAGRTGTFTPGLFMFSVVDEDEAAIDEILSHPIVRVLGLVAPGWMYEDAGAEHPLGADFHGLTDYIPTRFDREAALAAIDRVPEEVLRRFLLCGTPDAIATRLREYEAAGCEHAVVWNVSFLTDLSKVASSFRLMAELRADLAGG